LKLFCILTVVLVIVRFDLTLWKLDDVNFHFCERVYYLVYGRNSDVSVGLLVGCVVLRLNCTGLTENYFNAHYITAIYIILITTF
jgi:hypothetical protein